MESNQRVGACLLSLGVAVAGETQEPEGEPAAEALRGSGLEVPREAKGKEGEVQSRKLEDCLIGWLARDTEPGNQTRQRGRSERPGLKRAYYHCFQEHWQLEDSFDYVGTERHHLMLTSRNSLIQWSPCSSVHGQQASSVPPSRASHQPSTASVLNGSQEQPRKDHWTLEGKLWRWTGYSVTMVEEGDLTQEQSNRLGRSSDMAIHINPVSGRARTWRPASWVPAGQHSDFSKGCSSSEVISLLLSVLTLDSTQTIFVAFLKSPA